MKRTLIVTTVLAAGTALLLPAYADAAQNHNSSRSNRVSGISGGSVDIVSTGGTGLALELFDENGVLIPTTEFHETTPSNSFNLITSAFDLPAVVFSSGPLIGLWGIDPASNVTGQTGAAGSTTMFSEMTAFPPQSQVCPPLCGGSEVDTTTIFTANEIQTLAAKEKKELDKAKQGRSIAADRSQLFFDAHTDAQVNLSYLLEELILEADLTGTTTPITAMTLGFGVQWAFGVGSVIGESELFSDSVLYEISVDLDDSFDAFTLTDELIYDLTLDLDAGQQYWLNVDSFSYTVAVPEPSTLGLMLVPALSLLFRRRKA